VSPHAQSIVPSPERSRSLEHFQDAADKQEEVEEEEYDSEAEEEDMERFLDTEDMDPVTTARDEIRGWPELQEQIKADFQTANKGCTGPTQINQLIILRNFATLRIKGLGRMAASEQIVQQWHEGWC